MSETYRREYIVCPWCAEDSGGRIDHLFNGLPRSWGPWYCEKCQRPFRGTVGKDNAVTVEKDEADKTRFVHSLSLLKFEGKDGPVFFVMKDRRYIRNNEEETEEEIQEHRRYFFEEHSCPTNWLRDCVAVIEDGDQDPHGFLEFVRCVDTPPDYDEHKDGWEKYFPEAFNTKDIDGEAREIGTVLTLGTLGETAEQTKAEKP